MVRKYSSEMVRMRVRNWSEKKPVITYRQYCGHVSWGSNNTRTSRGQTAKTKRRGQFDCTKHNEDQGCEGPRTGHQPLELTRTPIRRRVNERIDIKQRGELPPHKDDEVQILVVVSKEIIVLDGAPSVGEGDDHGDVHVDKVRGLRRRMDGLETEDGKVLENVDSVRRQNEQACKSQHDHDNKGHKRVDKEETEIGVLSHLDDRLLVLQGLRKILAVLLFLLSVRQSCNFALEILAAGTDLARGNKSMCE